jgi:hypothetical protein
VLDLEMKKLRLRNMKTLAQGHTADGTTLESKNFGVHQPVKLKKNLCEIQKKKD